MLYFVEPQMHWDCTDGCADGYFKPCIMNSEKLEKLRKKLETEFCLSEDWTSGGHVCWFEFSGDEIKKNLVVKEITPEEVETILKFSLADTYEESLWVQNIHDAEVIESE